MVGKTIRLSKALPNIALHPSFLSRTSSLCPPKLFSKTPNIFLLLSLSTLKPSSLHCLLDLSAEFLEILLIIQEHETIPTIKLHFVDTILSELGHTSCNCAFENILTTFFSSHVWNQTKRFDQTNDELTKPIARILVVCVGRWNAFARRKSRRRKRDATPTTRCFDAFVWLLDMAPWIPSLHCNNRCGKSPTYVEPKIIENK
jgi:hypothetical protein